MQNDHVCLSVCLSAMRAKGRNPLGELVGTLVANPGWQLVSN